MTDKPLDPAARRRGKTECTSYSTARNCDGERCYLSVISSLLGACHTHQSLSRLASEPPGSLGVYARARPTSSAPEKCYRQASMFRRHCEVHPKRRCSRVEFGTGCGGGRSLKRARALRQHAFQHRSRRPAPGPRRPSRLICHSCSALAVVYPVVPAFCATAVLLLSLPQKRIERGN